MANRVFRPAVETFEQYYDAKMRLIDRAEPGCPIRSRTDLIIDGIQDLSMHVLVKQGNYVTPESIFAALKFYRPSARVNNGLQDIKIQLEKLTLALTGNVQAQERQTEVNAIRPYSSREYHGRGGNTRCALPNPPEFRTFFPTNQQQGNFNNNYRGQGYRGVGRG